MAQVLNLSPLSSSTRPESNCLRLYNTTRTQDGIRTWFTLQRQLKCNGKFTCLFSGNSGREEQARRALDSALGGKKDEFEKWNKEIKKREEAGGGGDAGGGGWFGWGRRFGWSNGDNFLPELKQTLLAILGILAMYLVVAKGEVLLAIVINPWLHVLRGTRNGLTFISSKILGKTSADSPADFTDKSREGNYVQASAKQRVVRKWGSD
ncbi:uncharacterized protein [Euphorbia lathyris]|uniref:uncharacterized protein n=1 Tax=Euphorbia lathyris TaxID=212925 RepID=UPI0033135551